MSCSSNKYLGDIYDTEVGEDGRFTENYVNQLKTACNGLFSDMCKSSGVKETFNLYSPCLNKPTITKAHLIEWLTATTYLLEHCGLPLLDSAVEQKSELDDLKNEKIADQKKIIQLQEQLIEKKDKELNTVKKTVESELKSYSSVVERTCSAALAPQKIASAVSKVKREEDRSNNVVVFGLPEEEHEDLESKVKALLENLEEKPKVVDCCWVGSTKSTRIRPIKFSVNSSNIVYQLLSKAKKLKDVDGYSTVYIAPDRSVEERLARQKLVAELKEKRSSDTSKHYVIRKGAIMPVDW